MLVKIDRVLKEYGSRTILSDVSFTIEPGQKIALVGSNGSGKSTLLKIIAGLIETDSGKIILAKGVHVAYLKQDTAEDNLKMSSGEKMRENLRAILREKPDVLLLDEPTNNLDLPALFWLENFLKETTLACIVVSHDRAFLDRVVSYVIELDKDTHAILESRGTYSDYLERKKKEREKQEIDYRLQQENIDRLLADVRNKKEHAKAGAKFEANDKDKFTKGFFRDRAKSSDRAAIALEKRLKRMDKVEKPKVVKPFAVPLTFTNDAGVADIILSDVEFSYGPEFKLGPVNIDIRLGSRVAILGSNGSGKSTLMKIISGSILPEKGNVFVGSGVRMANFMQEHDSLPREFLISDYLKQKLSISETDAYKAMAHAGLDSAQVNKKIETLSPGGRARLLLTIFSFQAINTLLLDEPTNHLDIEALSVLESAVSSFSGTIVVVSHDRYFLSKVPGFSFFEMSHGKLNLVPDIEDYFKKAEKLALKKAHII
ncbi:MAG: ABC-F family ATP-binding cassette domain-containing protein [Candidatus Paceibacterota bacterium]|jgi:ATPase subunit of ABC transporter with duplicated ATPase domains